MSKTKHCDVIKLSIVIPCFSEDKTLKKCVEGVRKIAGN